MALFLPWPKLLPAGREDHAQGQGKRKRLLIIACSVHLGEYRNGSAQQLCLFEEKL